MPKVKTEKVETKKVSKSERKEFLEEQMFVRSEVAALRKEVAALKAALKTGKKKPEFVRGLPEVVLSYLPTDKRSDLDKFYDGLCDDEERSDLRKALERFCSAWENFREDDSVTVFSMALRATEVAFVAPHYDDRDSWTLAAVIEEFFTQGGAHIITQEVAADRSTHYLTIYQAETERTFEMDYEPGD